MPIKILIADDHKIVREGLRLLIERQKNMEVVGEAENGRQAAKFAKELHPDLVIMDVAMPDSNGVESTNYIKNDYPNIKVLALSMHSDKMFVIRMLKAGASGYLLKECAFEELANAIHTVMEDNIYLSPQIAHIIVDDWIHNPIKTEPDELTSLSSREKEVLQLLAEGKSTQEIASLLYLSVKTIDSHRRNVMIKLDAKSIAELTKIAIRQGLTSLE